MQSVVKKIPVLIVCLCLLNQAFAQTFSSQNSGVTTQLNAISFSSSSTGIVVGNSGVIRKTSDAGLTWSVSNSGTTADLTDVVYVTASTFIAVGKLGTILKTNNAGSSWTAVSSGTSNDLLGVAANSLDIYISGSNGTVLKSTNLGNAWTSLNTGIFLKLNKPCFVSDDTGYIVGEAGTVIKTNNGGQSWTFPAGGPNTHNLTSVWFSAESHGVVSGGITASNEAILMRTVNSASSWASNDLSNFYLSAVSFADYSNGFAVGGSVSGNTSVILKTTNQGASWSPVATNSSRQLGVCFPNLNVAYTCGLNGTILRFASNTVGLEEPDLSAVELSPNPGAGIFKLSSHPAAEFTIEVFSPDGAPIVSVQNSNTIDLTHYPSGIYLAAIRSKSGNVMRRLVKE